MFRTICFGTLLLALGVALPAATFNAGLISYVDEGDGLGLLSVENFTGTAALPPDFPVLTSLSFSGTLTALYCELNFDCADAANQLTEAFNLDPVVEPGTPLVFSVSADRQYLFDQFIFSGSFLPASPFEVGGVSFLPSSQALTLTYLGDGSNWLLTLDGDELGGTEIPEPSSLVLFGANALFLLRRR